MEQTNGVILIPALELRNGSGHLARMIRLHMELENSLLYIPHTMQENLQKQFPELKECRSIGDLEEPNLPAPELYVIDMPEIEYSYLMKLKERAPVVAVDLGGEGRSYADYLLDTLPYPGTRHHRKYFGNGKASYPSLPRIPGLGALSSFVNGEAANFYDPGLLRPKPAGSENTSVRRSADRKSEEQGLENILVSFGGSDPGNLTRSFVNLLQTHEFLRSVTGSIIYPRRLKDSALPDLPRGWSWMEPVDDLSTRFPRYDLLICAYGLSAWEAQFSGLPVLILDASDYHRRLSVLSGFLSVPPDSLETAADQLRFPALREQLRSQADRVAAIPASSLGETIRSIRPHGNSCCPCCGNMGPNPIISRSRNRSYSACSRCGTVYLFRVTSDSFTYDESYFFSQYREQYGKTYIEDFQHIKSMGEERLKHIQKQLHPGEEQPSILDIGCAYGPFLQAAREAGFLCSGIDISPDAVEYVNSVLQIPAQSGDISDPEFRNSFGENQFSAVTMWYVIEHFPELGDILGWIRKILKPWGIFAISTPSNRGISGRMNLSAFLQNGPEDHYSVWNPRQADELGRFYSFMLAESRSTGHHPERFPSPFSLPWLKGLSMAASRAMDLGDSFEAYFINIPEQE
ncbi:methyltransferase domain-containing protein [Salinispira pacifica]|uniref:Cytidylyltransferase domain protein n=1 Tax=Salinispira pacifica TaxID=1307761 RepID=V5WI35_9SPIO|nr:methyltransferase domain-containing protein [Salinispira pacifica]AHC15285.1 cytidylyltransferase domain protein [Salinispira pacifica]